jgi:hypothetical protein
MIFLVIKKGLMKLLGFVWTRGRFEKNEGLQVIWFKSALDEMGMSLR